MSQIAQDYQDTKAARDEAAKVFVAALTKQYGSAIAGIRAPKSQDSAEVRAASDALELAAQAHDRARSIAFANGGDFALPARQEGGAA